MSTTLVQDLSEKVDPLIDCTKMSGDEVTWLANRYETLENRMNTFESNYTVL